MQTITAPKSHRADVPVGLSGIEPHDPNVSATYAGNGPVFVTHEPGVVALVLPPAAAEDFAAAIVAGINSPTVPGAYPQALQSVAIDMLEHALGAREQAQAHEEAALQRAHPVMRAVSRVRRSGGKRGVR